MLEDKRTPIQTQLAQMRGMDCFVCAPRSQNPIGLALEFEETEDGAKAEILFGDSFHSYPGIVHGGVVSAALDETMAYAIILKHTLLPFTASLKLDYRMPVHSTERYVVYGKVVSRKENKFFVEGRLKTQKGRALVLATAEFVVPTPELAKRMIPGADWTGFEKFLAK